MWFVLSSAEMFGVLILVSLIFEIHGQAQKVFCLEERHLHRVSLYGNPVGLSERSSAAKGVSIDMSKTGTFRDVDTRR
jgi:hypothetical protein